MSGETRRVTVRYFANLRDHAGRESEELKTAAATVSALYEELCARYGFPSETAHMRVAINDVFAHWGDSLFDGDRVVFIPPVAGG